ncbi:hypothetical protein VNO78_07986 [Psophocarpus tetragonolobus]|uniref:OVATE domain-containing protein n=1 Tax=Psophocarpus tetragonolobus TaxID=3891 RepID=A0AAN9T456_PSOTE
MMLLNVKIKYIKMNYEIGFSVLDKNEVPHTYYHRYIISNFVLNGCSLACCSYEYSLCCPNPFPATSTTDSNVDTATLTPPTLEPRIKAIGERVTVWEQESINPCEDFRRSIRELIEVYPELADSYNLSKLFYHYLECNPETMHPYILRSFFYFSADLTLQRLV